MAINNVVISGNLTRDAELRELKNDGAVLSFSVAVNDRFYDRDAEEYAEYANYFDCVMFGARAKALADFLKKGTKVAVSGKLHYSSWETDEGKRSKVEITALEIEFLTPRSEDEKPKRKGYNRR